MEQIIRNRIAVLERDLQREEKKVYPGAQDLTKHAIEAEKIKYAIQQLYICLGSPKE